MSPEVPGLACKLTGVDLFCCILGLALSYHCLDFQDTRSYVLLLQSCPCITVFTAPTASIHVLQH